MILHNDAHLNAQAEPLSVVASFIVSVPAIKLSGLEPVSIGTGSLFVNVGERTNVTGSKAFARMNQHERGIGRFQDFACGASACGAEHLSPFPPVKAFLRTYSYPSRIPVF